MLHYNFNISRLIVHAQYMEEFSLERMYKEKRSRSDEQDQSRPKNRFYDQDALMVNKRRVPNRSYQGGNRGGSFFERHKYAKCGKQNMEK